LSHLKERKEKNCLNCNAQVQGRFCHICGQENIEPKESLWHLVSHFFQDITHFDGKFFSSLKLLITRPGFLSREYMLGRRASYLNPIRMYIFTSAIFFLLFSDFLQPKQKTFEESVNISGKTIAQINKMDSTSFSNFTRNINREDGKKDIAMTREEFKQYADTVSFGGFQLFGSNYSSSAQYDSLLHAGVVKHSWFTRMFIHKVIVLNEKYKNKKEEALHDFAETMLHSLPQMLFVSLPLLALLLKLLYFRKKQFYYVSHGIFSIQYYIFIFINLLVLAALNKLNIQLNWSLIVFVKAMLYLGLFFYLYKAMRNFYQQKRAKTIFKFLLLNFLFFIVLVFELIFFVFFSIFKL
jgi:Protein of unknown function (DUF3667)